jgi:H+-translocating NAD(P) transhydrogenase subunit alpha
MSLTVGVPKETLAGERRVAISPDVVARLRQSGCEVVVERGAGLAAHYPDADYEAQGASMASNAEAMGADIVAKVHAPSIEEAAFLNSGAVVIAFMRPLDDPGTVARLAARGVTALSMELVPRTTRAQKMDALSAMSTVAGYKAALLAADLLPRFFPLLTTAAGTMRPARVLVLGAGVAGLQALATARRLGAVTLAYDVREAAREQVESVGASFVELALDTAGSEDAGGYAKALAEDQQARQVELLSDHFVKADVVISTALIPGRPAPVLITQQGIERMQPGSVVIDLAAPNGGNCTLTRPDEIVHHAGVTIVGPTNLAAEMPMHASQMYARTVMSLITEFIKDGVFLTSFEDDIFKSVCLTYGGEVVNERVRGMVAAQA